MNAKKLIEETLPLPQINTASDTDKRTHDGHISTMHTWWARRPLPMARAVAAASLIDSGEDAAEVEEKIAQAMTTKALTNNQAISWLRNRIRDSGAGRPKVLDCFAGGGAIPLEALRLGCDTTAMDLNPVAHLIELACLDYPQRYRDYNELGRNSLAADVERWADRVSQDTRKAIDHLYPRAEGQSDPAPYYFWVRTMPSPDPNVAAEIPILSSRLLAAARRSAWVTTTASSEGVDIDVHQGTLPDDPSLKEGFESAGSVTCPISGITAPQRDVKQHGRDHGFGYRLYAVCDVDGRSRTYRRPTSVELEGPMRATSKAEALDIDEFDDGTPRLPDEAVDEIGYRNLQFLPYGYRTWRSLFTDRQLALFATLAASIRKAHTAMVNKGMDPDRATAVATYLAFALDKVADRNSAFSSWATNREDDSGHVPGPDGADALGLLRELSVPHRLGILERRSLRDLQGHRALRPDSRRPRDGAAGRRAGAAVRRRRVRRRADRPALLLLGHVLGPLRLLLRVAQAQRRPSLPTPSTSSRHGRPRPRRSCRTGAALA